MTVPGIAGAGGEGTSKGGPEIRGTRLALPGLEGRLQVGESGVELPEAGTALQPGAAVGKRAEVRGGGKGRYAQAGVAETGDDGRPNLRTPTQGLPHHV